MQNKRTKSPYYDPSLELQEVSPSRPFDAGTLPTEPPLSLSGSDGAGAIPTRNKPSLLRRIFYGNTQPGTPQGRSTAFKRGLLMAGLFGLFVAGIVAAIFVAKGVALLSLILPLAALVVGCLVVAAVGMWCYSLYKRCTERRHTQLETLDETSTYTQSRDYEFAPAPGNNRGPQYPPEAPAVLADFSSQQRPAYGSWQPPSSYAAPPSQNPYRQGIPGQAPQFVPSDDSERPYRSPGQQQFG